MNIEQLAQEIVQKHAKHAYTKASAVRHAIIEVKEITALLAEINVKETFNVSEYANRYHAILHHLNQMK